MAVLNALHYLAVDCHPSFLGFHSWNYYLKLNPNNCDIDPSQFHVLGANSSLLLIILAVLDDLFKLAGILAVAFVVYAGFQFVLSQGSPDETAKARTTGINALVGLGISIIATWFVSFLGARVDNGNGGTFGMLNVSPLPNPGGVASGSVLQTAFSVVFGILGAIAFLIIVIAGMTYAFSQGDPQTTAKSKSAIIYAVIGLVIAIAAQSIVSYAVNARP